MTDVPPRRNLWVMKRLLILLPLGLVVGSPAAAVTIQPAAKDTAVVQNKSPVRKAPEMRERKRPSSSVGRGCVGCIHPLDGIAATMAVRSQG